MPESRGMSVQFPFPPPQVGAVSAVPETFVPVLYRPPPRAGTNVVKWSLNPAITVVMWSF